MDKDMDKDMGKDINYDEINRQLQSFKMTREDYKRLIEAPKKPLFTRLREIPALEWETSSIMIMSELEYLFSHERNGFDDPDEILPSSLGLSGERWIEPFQVIGVMYDSLELFQAQKSKFKGKFYCSFFDEEKKLTCYLRNHQLVDETIKSIYGNITIADLYNAFLRKEQKNIEINLRKLEAGEFDAEFDNN